MNAKVPFAVMLFVSIIVSVYGFMMDQFIVLTLSLTLAALLTIQTLFSGIFSDFRLALLCTVMLTMFSVVAVLFEYDASGSLSRSAWAHLTGIVFWLISFPMAALILQVMSVLFDAKYNWPLIAGFMAFTSGALMTVAMVVVSFAEHDEISDLTISSLDFLSVLFMNFVLSCIVGIILSRILKKKRIMITRPNEVTP